MGTHRLGMQHAYFEPVSGHQFYCTPRRGPHRVPTPAHDRTASMKSKLIRIRVIVDMHGYVIYDSSMRGTW